MARIFLASCFILCLLISAPSAAAKLEGLTLQQAIERLHADGLSILYSSDMIKPWMRVRTEPEGDDPRAWLEQMLAPYGLVPKDGAQGILLIVRGESPVIDESATAVAESKPEPAEITRPPLTQLVVTASQYALTRGAVPAAATLSAADLDRIPNPGDDPLRAAARLPGAANADYTAKSNIRGGEVDEMLVRFDDLRLYNPFHLKDFQSIFSAIDPGITQQMSVFTGSFPSIYGDRMSSVIDVKSLPASDQPYREITASFFNASAMAKGGFNDGRGDWLVSTRRGNLDLFLGAIGSDLGSPSYLDFYARVGHWFTDSFGVSGNLLLFDDDVVLSDGDQEENAHAEYRDAYGWLRFDFVPSGNLDGSVIWARTDLDSERAGTVDKPGVAAGMLWELNEFSMDSVQTDWSWRIGEQLNIGFGGIVTLSDGRYQYADQVDFSLLFVTPGATSSPSRVTNLDVEVNGEYYSAYLNARYRLTEKLVTEVGLRWDAETVSRGNPNEFSPRLAMLYALGDSTDLRVSWGRYYQTETINELQVSDGITNFSRPQRSDHFVLGLEHSFSDNIDIRIEAYSKYYDRLRPRYENFLNPLVMLPELNPDRVRIAPDSARANGIETTLRYAGEGPWTWWVSYTWASVKDNFGNTAVRRSWDQTHDLDLGLGWRTEHWELNVVGNYHKGWPTTSIELATSEPFPLIATGPRNQQRLENYASIDIRAARLFRFSDTHSLSLFVEIANLSNRANNCCIEYELNDEGGSTFLETGATNSLPFIPSAGFVWRF